MPWNRSTNTATIRSAPGISKYQNKVKALEAKINTVVEHVVFSSVPATVSDEETEEVLDYAPVSELPNQEDSLINTDLGAPKTNVIEDDEENLVADNDQAELLRWHY